ncbi:MAG: tape measure protein [Veillonella sp.]|uniref:tape measure protein n=1 Tax=Veillonella sp. TaxID=1926307 RepID=UPI00290EDBE0|nr:tape measure protein [Veillonella sp.]MDU7210968.1 tape measure protein [Veillonella sp.]
MATLSNYISLSTNIPNAMNAAANATTKAYQSMSTLHNKMNGVSNASETLKASLGGIMNSFAGNLLANAVMNGVGMIKGAVNSITDTATEWASVQARLKLVAGSQENAIYLNKQIFESAQRARGGYMEMADAVIQVSQSAHDAFPDPRKAVEFMEGIQKVFAIGGASKEAQKNAMLQLTQGLASGQLQGDEFRSIAENAPMIENIIAKSMGVSRGELKKLASEGKITADVIKNAIMNNMPEIEKQFESLPKTWGDHMQSIKNKAIQAFEPVFQRISDLANSEGIRELVDNVTGAIQMVAPVFYWLVGVVGETINTSIWAFNTLSNFIRQHSSIMYLAMIVLGGVLSYYAVQAGIAAVRTVIAAGAMAVKAAADWVETAAILAMIVAQEGLNAALYACPLTWIIGLIVAVIAVFFLAVEVINYFCDTNISVLGIVVGAFYAFGSVIYNVFALGWNIIAAFVNFLANVFKDPLAAVGNLFVDIWNGIWSFIKARINDIIGAINKIPGVKIEEVGDSTGMLKRFEAAGGETTVMNKMEYSSITQAAMNGYDVGANLSLENLMPNMKGVQTPKEFDPSKLTPGSDHDAANKTKKNTGKTAKNTGKIAKSIDMTNEEIKALRESAIDKSLKKWQDANVIHIQMNNDVEINNGTDLDGFTSQISKGLKDAFTIQREGI